MSYRIIGDSCMDLTQELKKDSNIGLIPLTLIVDDEPIADDNTFNQREFLDKVKRSQKCPRSACPSPQDYMKEFRHEGDIYVITISSNLSGSYNSANLARDMYLEENPNKNIEIIDSRSASIAQTLIALKIKELIDRSNSFDIIKDKIKLFRDGLKTKFVLETLETLRKNGRLSGLQAFICSALNIKPVMGATQEGTIEKIDQSRGIVKALITMAKVIEEDVVKPYERTLGIAHCNNYERAVFVKNEILKRVPFKDSFIVDTAGVSSLYANDGGIITAY